MKKRRVLALVLAVTCILSGLIAAYHIFSRLRRNLISQQEQKLMAVAEAVDRSAQSFFEVYHDMLEYVTGRRGFIEAESHWLETGETEDLLFRMEENLLNQDMQIRTMLAIDDGKILLSTDGSVDYVLPEECRKLFLCYDGEGNACFAVVHKREALCYAAVMELDDLAVYLTENCGVSEEDQLLLMDGEGKLAIAHQKDKTLMQPLAEELLSRAKILAVTRQAVGTEHSSTGLCEVDGEQDGNTVGYALIGDSGSENGFFTICISMPYDSYLDALALETILLIISFCVIMAGIFLLLLHVSSLSRENRKAAQELERMKQREAALEKINRQTQQLAHHQRLETIGTLTSSISHEFNNLLTPIMSYSLLTLEKLPADDEELYDNVLEIYNASQKAKVIISRLSDLSRKNSSKTFRETSIDDLIKKALDVAMPAKPETVEVKLNLNCSDLRIRVNEIQITQMLLNLFLNAFQAMEQGGVLEIHTTLDDTHVQIHVKDSGCGIPEEVRGKIFDPFFTTKESGKGTGLGLAIVAQVIEDHGGTIDVSSTPGMGTYFKVRLPRVLEKE